MKCQNCNTRHVDSVLSNLAGDIKLVCNECANEIREKQMADMLFQSFRKKT